MSTRKPYKLRSARLQRAVLPLALAASVAAFGQPAPKTRTFRFTYQATVGTLPAGTHRLDLWLPFPQSDANQTIRGVTIQAPGPVTLGTEPIFGNQALSLHAEHPVLPVEVSLSVTATRRENCGEKETLSPEQAARYLQPEPLVPLDGPVRQLAIEATRGRKTNGEKARAIYEKVTAMMKYDKSGTGWGRGDALFACAAQRGNCTDFHALIIGACRSLGIPARFAIGFSLPEQHGAGLIPGYHCWAEVYVAPAGWIPVDSSEGSKALAAGNVQKKNYYYGHHDENRLEFSRGRNLLLEPPQQDGPLNFFVYPYAEVDGKRYDAVERNFRFQDL